MKTIIYILLLTPVITFSQEDNFNPLKRKVIDSIHSKRLCEVYPGPTRFLTTQEAFDESEYVFIGTVTEIIRTEKLEPQDYRLDENDKLIPLYEAPTYDYWYVLKTKEVYKGDVNDYLRIYSRKFSSVLPLLMLDKEYLIYAVQGELQEYPYIYCGGNSKHIRYAENDIKEIEKILNN
jgi:hypothetical protein